MFPSWFLLSAVESSTYRGSGNYLLYLHTHYIHNLMLWISWGWSQATRPVFGVHHFFLLPLGNYSSIWGLFESICYIHCCPHGCCNSCACMCLCVGAMHWLNNGVPLNQVCDEPGYSSQVHVRWLHYQWQWEWDKPWRCTNVRVCVHLCGPLAWYYSGIWQEKEQRTWCDYGLCCDCSITCYSSLCVHCGNWAAWLCWCRP